MELGNNHRTERFHAEGGQTMLRKRYILVAAIFAIAVIPVESVRAETHSFEGTCAIVGVAELDHPITMLPSPNHVVFRGRGSCSGRVDGERLPAGGVPAELTSSGDKLTGCTGTVVPELAVTIRIRPERRRSTAISGTAQVTFTGNKMSSLVHGAGGGTAIASGTVQGGSELVEDCAAGKLTTVGVSFDLTTTTPLVSDDSATGGERSREPSATERSRLTVRPSRVKACEKTRFSVRATRAGRTRPVALAGARVRIGNATAKLNRRGRTTLTARLCERGRHRIAARVAGAPEAVAWVRAVR